MNLLTCFFILILIVVTFLKSPKGKGKVGELMVNQWARIYLDKDDYQLLKDVTLLTDTGTTQIDHIIVSKYGIFVIETKNMKGWIFGKGGDRNWTQKIYRKSVSFQNPLRQNYKHTKTISESLNVEHDKIFSLIVFVGDSVFKTEMPQNVMHGKRYLDFIRAKTDIIFNTAEVTSIVKGIEHLRLKSGLKTDRKHIEQLESLHSIKSNNYRFPLTKVLGLLFVGYCFLIFPLSSKSLITKPIEPKSSKLLEVLFKKEKKHSLDILPITPAKNSVTNNNTEDTVVYKFSASQIEKAKQDLFKLKKTSAFSQHTSNDADQVPLIRLDGTENEAQNYLYEIKLISGTVITSDNLVVGNNKLIFMNKRGLVVSINSSEVKSVNRLFLH